MDGVHAGSAFLKFSSGINQLINDDVLFRLGTDGDQVFLNRSSILNANTSLTNILIGTPVAQALAANSLIISNVTAGGDMAFYGNPGGNSQQFLFYDTSAGSLYLRSASDGAVYIGNSASNIGTFGTNRFSWDGVAYTYATATNFGRIEVRNTNAITVNTATVPVLASLILNEPNITIGTGAVTTAATLYIAGAPTEGSTSNNSIYVASGTSTFMGHIGLMTEVVPTVSLYCVDTQTIADDSTSGFTGSAFEATVNKTTQAWTQDCYVRGVTGAARVGASNTQNWTMPLGVRGVTSTIFIQAGATGVITGGVNYYAAAIISAATLTNRYGLYVLEATGAGTVTNQYGIYIEALTKGVAINYPIFMAGLAQFEAKGLTFLNNVDSAAVADTVSLGGYDISAGHRALAISSEEVVAAEVDETKFSHKLPVRINGGTYNIMLCAT